LFHYCQCQCPPGFKGKFCQFKLRPP
uniref:NU-conotoxin-Ltg1a n=1 Tax=Conus litoglyphus TaxID=97191 RepID=CU1A_CONLO|nr:RecName: Full=NU-conotoxin-Ltg1a; Short=NU-CTX-Ltg1a; AltName: Full=N-CTX-Ltg1a [Conus litoglyphus]